MYSVRSTEYQVTSYFTSNDHNHHDISLLCQVMVGGGPSEGISLSRLNLVQSKYIIRLDSILVRTQIVLLDRLLPW